MRLALLRAVHIPRVRRASAGFAVACIVAQCLLAWSRGESVPWALLQTGAALLALVPLLALPIVRLEMADGQVSIYVFEQLRTVVEQASIIDADVVEASSAPRRTRRADMVWGAPLALRIQRAQGPPVLAGLKRRADLQSLVRALMHRA